MWFCGPAFFIRLPEVTFVFIMKCLGYILALFCLLPSVSAQQKILFTRLSTEDGTGLSSNRVCWTYQDKKGFIWVGTGNGLQRFDGIKFTDAVVKTNGSDPLPHDLLAQIEPLDEESLILYFSGLREIGLYNFSTLTYHKLRVDLSKEQLAKNGLGMWRDKLTGKIYIVNSRTYFLEYSKKEAAFLNTNPFHLPNDYIPDMAGIYHDGAKKQFWIAGIEGLAIYDEHSRQLWTKDNNPQNLPILKNTSVNEGNTELHIDQQRRLWIFNWPHHWLDYQVLHCFDSTGSYEIPNATNGLRDGENGYVEYRHFYETSKGDLWMYGPGTLYDFDALAGRFRYHLNNVTGPDRGITFNTAYNVMEDRDGNIWVSTDRGLFYTDQHNGSASVINYSLEKPGINKFQMTDIVELPDKSFWCCAWGGVVMRIDKNLRDSTLPFNKLYALQNGKLVKTVFGYSFRSLCWQKTTGKVLIGCNNDKLLQYDPVTTTCVCRTVEACGGSSIYTIAEDQKGTVWMATKTGRLIKWEKDSFSLVQDVQSIVRKLLVDKQGWVWLATEENGVYAIDPVLGKIIQHYTKNNTASSLYSGRGYDIDQLNDSILVYGAGALDFINKRTGAVRQFTYQDGLPSNSVTRVRVDAKGFLWIMTSSGLCRYNPVNNRISTYDHKDGINVMLSFDNADYVASDGRILFGGGSSLLIFDPAVLGKDQTPPNITISGFRLFSQNLPVDSLQHLPEVRLKHDENSFTLFFTALSFAQKDKLVYHYQMEGIDKDWEVADNTYSRTYSLLPPGHYTFKIYGETVGGQRSANVTEMHIYIRPPFWATGWFICLCVLVVAGIVYTIHNARISKLLAMEKLRNRVARDLHDDMGSTLSTINILSAMAKTKMSVDTVKTSEYLTKISDNSQRMMEAMDDIVWSIKPSNDSLQKITARMREFATNVLEAKDMGLDFHVDENVYTTRLNMAARRDFFLIFKEAVNNAAKYSNADKVVVRVSCSNRRLKLIVKDNGQGFITKRADGNGLSNMTKRADSLNGSINIKSAPGQGTEVNLSIPV